MFTAIVRSRVKAAKQSAVPRRGAPAKLRAVSRKADPAVQRCSCARANHQEREGGGDSAIEAHDPLEREADSVAGQIVDSGELGQPPRITSQPNLRLANKCSSCESEEEEESAGLLQRKPAAEPSRAAASGNSLGLLGSGRALNEEERAYFEPRFGRDLSRLRLHTGSGAASAAAELGARAFTCGQHVTFGEGQHNVGSRSGKWLLAHEITHFVQQNSPQLLHRREESAPRHPMRILARLGPGDPLGSNVRSRMEAAFGSSFGDVRVHRNSRSAQMCSQFNASAFAVGDHVAFVPHLYRPGTVVGDALLAHELAHVEQQKGQKPRTPSAAVSVNQADLETDANSTTRSALLRLWRHKVTRPLQRALPSLLGPAIPRISSPVRLSLASCGDSSTTTPTAADPCEDICRRANDDPKLNHDSGGVVCDGETKCPCSFDIPEVGLRRGECRDFDEIVIAHERRHLSESVCDSSLGLHRSWFADPSQSQNTTSECTHRRESIRLVDRTLPTQSSNCKAKMKIARDSLESWVGDKC